MRSFPISRDSFDVIVVQVRFFHAGAFAGAAGTVVGAMALKFSANQKRILDGINEKAYEGPDLVRIGEALDELAAAEPAPAETADMKFFCGFTFRDCRHEDTSESTAQRQWEKARIHPHRKLSTDLGD